MGTKKPLQTTSRQSRSVLRKMKNRVIPNAKAQKGSNKIRPVSLKSEKNVISRKSETKEAPAKHGTQRSSSSVSKHTNRDSSLNSLALPETGLPTTSAKSNSGPNTPKKTVPSQRAHPDEDKAKAINKMLKSLDIKISGFKSILPDEQKSAECNASISEIVKTKSRAAANKGGMSAKETGKKVQVKKGNEKVESSKQDDTSSQNTKDLKVKEIISQAQKQSKDTQLSKNAIGKKIEEKETKVSQKSGDKIGTMKSRDTLQEKTLGGVKTLQLLPQASIQVIKTVEGEGRKKPEVTEDFKKDKGKVNTKQTKKSKKNPPDKNEEKSDEINLQKSQSVYGKSVTAHAKQGRIDEIERHKLKESQSSKSTATKKNLNRIKDFKKSDELEKSRSTSVEASGEVKSQSKSTSLATLSKPVIDKTSEDDSSRKLSLHSGSSLSKKSKSKVRAKEEIPKQLEEDKRCGEEVLKAKTTVMKSTENQPTTEDGTLREDEPNLKESERSLNERALEKSFTGKKSALENPKTKEPDSASKLEEHEQETDFTQRMGSPLPKEVSSNSDSTLSKLLSVRERLQKKYVQSRTTSFKSFKLSKQAKSIKKPVQVKPQNKSAKLKILKDVKTSEKNTEKKEKDIYDFKTESESEDNIKMNLLIESSVLSKIRMENDFSDEDDKPLQLTKLQLKEERGQQIEKEKQNDKKSNSTITKEEKKSPTSLKKGAQEKKSTPTGKAEKKQIKSSKKSVVNKRKERSESSSSSDGSSSESDDSSESSRLKNNLFGPKRHRMASLNALAKVQCLYENESRTAHELGLSKSAQIPKIRLINSGSSSEEDKDQKKKEAPVKEVKKEEPVIEIENKRELRNAPGLRGVGKHWDFNDVSSFESGHESDVTFRAGLEMKSKTKKKRISKPKVPTQKEKEKEKEKPKKPVKTQKKKPRTPPSSSSSSDEDEKGTEVRKGSQGNKKRKRDKNDDIGNDFKEMLARKRMASLNASALVAATYEVERHLDRNLNSDCSSFESFLEDEKPIVVNTSKKSKESKKTSKANEDSKESKDNKEGKEGSRPTSSSVVIVQDTDVTITGVYVNSSTGSSQEAYCKMQYRVQSSVTEERVLRPNSIDPPKSYTPLGALSSMRPPGSATEGQQHPPAPASGQQQAPPPSAPNIYHSPTNSQEQAPPNTHMYPSHHPGSPIPPAHHQHPSEQSTLHHHHHPPPPTKYQHLQHHHHHQQQPHQPTLIQSRCESPVRYQSGAYQSVQPPLPPSSLTMPGSGASAFCAPLQQSHHDMSGYYQPAGPLISPHVLPSVPSTNPGLVSAKQVPSPLDSDPDQLQQPPPSTSAAESSDSEVLITGGDLTTFRYPSQQQQTPSQQLSVLSSQQQQQQSSPYTRSMHQMHYPPAYPPSYYSPYPGDAMCYSPPYQPYFPAKVYQSAPAYRRYPSYYQPGHPPPSDLYEAPPPSSGAPPPPAGSQLVPAGPTAPQHMEHYPGPPGFYTGYSPGGGQCYSRGMQPPYMEYPPPCPCPMQSCPKNVLTGPLIGSNSSGSGNNTISNNGASNTIITNSNSTNNSNSISSNNNTSNNLSSQSQPLKTSKGPVQQQQHPIKSHSLMLGPIEPSNQITNGPMLGKSHLHHHHMHQCKMEIMEPLKPDLKTEINDRVISTDSSNKGSQYEEIAVPPTLPTSYTVNDKLIEPEITVSPARGSTGLPTVPDQTEKAANPPQPSMTATIPRENVDTVPSTNLPTVIGRKARIGKSMAREMMYGAHALHHQQQHPQIYNSHTHIHHHLTSHTTPEMAKVNPIPEAHDPVIVKPELSKIKKEEIKTEEDDVVVILDDDKQEAKKIKTEPEIVEVLDDRIDSASKQSSRPESPEVHDVDIPRQLNSKRMKILEQNKGQCKKSPPNGYKSLIKQTEPKPYLCLSRKSEKKDRFMKITSKGGLRKRKLMLTEQQKKRLIMRKRKLMMLERKRQIAEKAEKKKAPHVRDELKSKDELRKVEERQNGFTLPNCRINLLSDTPSEHAIDFIARGYFSEPEIRSSVGRKSKKAKSTEARSKSETKKSPEETNKIPTSTSVIQDSELSKHKSKAKGSFTQSSNSEENSYENLLSEEKSGAASRKGKQNKCNSTKLKCNKISKCGRNPCVENCTVDNAIGDHNQTLLDKSTGVNINNNFVEANNNKLLEGVTTELVDEEKLAQTVISSSEQSVEHIFNCPPPKRARSRTKFGNRKRQRTRHSIANQVVDTVVIPRKLNVVPRWNNGWSWEGEPFQGKVFLNSDDPLVIRTCYPAMRHEEGDVVRPRDCVLLRAGTKKNELPYVAKVAHLWENPEDGEMMMSLLWYYRPEHTEQGRQSNDCSDEVFASRHRDHNSVACIEDKCYVLTFSEYCRYRRSVRAAEEGIEEQISIVPSLTNYCNPREVPVNTNPEQVLFCQRVYDFRLKRLVKTPNYN